ncbi:MAG: NAD(P)-dependent oxidoreductase [Chloroflexi bacterium]|nr:NAD(P)-dependent oxidoreductase [Chloroflexota bacterium]
MSGPLVAFLGLGAMGQPMARNVVKAGFSTVVWNRTPGRADALTTEGARAAGSPGEAVAEADVVMTMLTDAPAVEAVALGPSGFLPSVRTGATYVDMSTVTPSTSHKLAEAAAARGVRFLDAPVLGTIGPAADGTLTIVAGGEAATLDAVRPVLDCMGSRIIHAGPAGMGTWLKLLANVLMATSMQSFFELLALGQRAGFERVALAEMLGGLPVASPAIKARAGTVAAGDFSTRFPLDLMLKDVRQHLEAAGELGVAQPLAALTHGLFTQARTGERGGLDFSVVALAAEEAAGVRRGQR